MPSPPLTVLIVDDSATARAALRRAMEAPGSPLRVVAEARNGDEALERLEAVRPDLVTMDVHLGREDGVELTARIMAARPVPVVVVTSLSVSEPGLAFRAMEAGALDVLARPVAATHPDYEDARRRLVRVLGALATVPLVTRRRAVPPLAPASAPPPTRAQGGLVLLGASTGGPPLLQSILRELPRPFGAPVVIVQHVAQGFGVALGQWLRETTGQLVEVVQQPTLLQPGRVYLAPDDAHLELVGSGVRPGVGPPRGFHRPSIDVLFETAARALPRSAVGVLLTGMGEDGAAGLAALRAAGAFTVAQEPSTCVVSSMPASAIRRGAVDEVLLPGQVAAGLVRRIHLAR
ncbi:MAG: response regulator [Deltaproteobacteria bacterium]|nr:response regulator [Deltaproteobacteria bacterium]